MSKKSNTSADNLKSLPAKSAWAKGPPQFSKASPRSQSPTLRKDSTRLSALGQATSFKDGVSIPSNIVGAAATKQGSAVTFGSIDDTSAQTSSSRLKALPSIKDAIVKSFGTVPTARSPAPLSSTPSPAQPGPPEVVERDGTRLPRDSPAPPASSSSDTPSPSVRSANLPDQIQTPGTPSSPSQFTPFIPSWRPRPQAYGPDGGSNRSPVHPLQTSYGPAPASPHDPPRQLYMPPQMVWNGGYYYPDPYAPYPSWGYGAPRMPPQEDPPHTEDPPHVEPPTASLTNDEETSLTKDEWIDVLKLSTKQRSNDLRTLAIHHISSIEMDPIDRICLAKEYKVYEWLLQGYEQVIDRLLIFDYADTESPTILTEEEGTRIGLGAALKLSGIVIRRTRCPPGTPMKDVKSDILDTFKEEFDGLRSEGSSFATR
ncbi:hypothetical protein BKA70DRAFT_1199864 [Coprinopsis sp. MPI-PUGE-AT-0042]|nr:hypothetical protein BKA70DRAFT_1199864 [Coprinopsis sp. MPI-PUGE-AT-0042]